MKKPLFLFVYLLLNLYAGVKAETLSATEQITGKTIVGIDVTESYQVTKNDNVTSFRWIPPVGCQVIEGQGSENVLVKTTYLSRNSDLQVIRGFSDSSMDTLKLEIDFHRTIGIVKDHKIAPGESMEIAGEQRQVADIYYEYGTDENQRPLITAHRLTVEPKAGVYVEMTKPYLQTLTDNSVWVCWKTDYDAESTVIYGQDGTSMNLTLSGNAEKLSDTYYWHSVQLTDLSPNTLYTYKIKSGNRESEVYRFKTAPEKGSRTPMRILLMGDHQMKSRSGYEWLMQAAKRKIEEKYGNVEENIDMIMNVGDQVDVGTLDHYEHVHLYKSELLSPYLSIMTAVGNHETYSDPGMENYAAHYHYEDLEYQGIQSGTENYYAYQIGRILFIVLSTEHTGNVQKAWVRKVVDAVKNDDSVDFVISVNHRPIQAEQYIGDISTWVRNEIVPILSETDKHIFNYGGHHHLYHRGQWPDSPFYHIINGAASWDQMWGMSSEKDYDDVQKTIDYWAYQILEFDFDKKEMKAECYAIGNRELVVDNILIDKFHRRMGQEGPVQPVLESLQEETIQLPYTFRANEYVTTAGEAFNTSQFQIATSEDFSNIALNVIRDVENLYGSTGQPWHIPVDIHEFLDITELTVTENKLKNGVHYIRVRYRDENLEWSPWSEVQAFTVEGSIDGDPAIFLEKKSYALNENISIRFEFVPEGQDAWIGIYRAGKNPGSGSGSVKWGYTSTASGTLNFSLNETGEYYAVLFEDGGYTEAAPRIPFYVGELPVITLEKTAFEEGEPIKVSYSNAPGLSSDWIGIYKVGHTPGNEYSSSWLYTTAGSESGELILSTGSGNASKLSKGYYFINYFTNGGYFEPAERQYISVGSDISSLSAEKDNFDPDEDIIIYYADGPGTPKDWVGAFEKSKVVEIDELDGFYYTYGETDGYVTIPGGELPAADYFFALYINDSYDEVSPRIYLSVGKAPELIVEEETEGILTFGFEDNEKWRKTISNITLDSESISAQNYEIEAGKVIILKEAFPEKEGTYTISIKSTTWQDTSLIVEIGEGGAGTSVNIPELSDMKIYPNPVEDILYIENPESVSYILILTDIHGTVCWKEEIRNLQSEIKVGNLVPGVYLLILSTEEGYTVSSQVLLKK
ncbi:MAG: fibronectin type III domain-containing protein [Candidatus Azobacteroides sp.]|nr:fibronectin type III domain-containing protein [Candidatus Azobacteroides sp.]